MGYEKLSKEYNSFVNIELDKLFNNILPEGKNLCIFFYTDNIPISIIKQEFTIYLRNLLNQQQEFTIKDKIKEVSFKISLYEKTGNNQGIWGGILPKSSSQIKLI